MPDETILILVAVAVVAVLIAGLVVARRRPTPRQGPTAEDLATLERMREREVELEAPPPEKRGPEVTRKAPPPVEVKPPPELEVSKEPVPRLRPSLGERIAKSRRFLTGMLADAFRGRVDEETWDDLEAALIQADVGPDTTTRVIDDLKTKARAQKITDAGELRDLLADELVSLLDEERDRSLVFAPTSPTVWMVVGVNGTGKTTTIGKLAVDLGQRGRSVVLAAADTFRAAADEQLDVWAQRSGADVVKHQPGADPGAVAYDAFQHARARGTHVLIVDTAGRLHTKVPLMAELGKVRRVIEKEGKVQEALLVIDATAGQNGLNQAREFAAATGVTGVVLTKLDGTAKGGIVLAIEQTLGIPIKLIGVGEGLDDLEPFDPKSYIDALLS